MDDGDDDFGDLYADVEVEATSAINIAPKFSKTQCVNDEIGKQDGDNDRACISIDNDEDEDDDDDLDIVLNNDDDNVKRGDDYTILRNSANLRSGELEDEDDDNLRADELAVGNSRSLYKYLRSQSAAYWHQFGSGSMGPQTAQRFSLPRARNILDVNIDVFEQKPWKHPGADITDYFNFGFNEDSWKLYCNQVDEYRHRGPVSSGTPPSELTQSTEVDRRKGQAIQVEDGIFEHQSSMDVRRQLDRDSDAIQITILDPDNASVPETSNHGDVSGDDITDHLSFSSASEDESVEEKDLGKDWRSGSENHEIHQVALDETIRTSNDEKESNFVTESSEDERNPANHIKSDDACVDRRKAYTHDRCLTELSLSVRPDYHHPEDSNKSDVKRGSDESRYYARRLSDNRKHGDRIYHERSNSPVYKNRAHKDLILKTPHENDYFTSRRSYDKRKSGEYSYHAKHNNGFFPMSDEVHSTFRQGLHAFDPYEENISYLKSEVYSDYYGERFHGYEDRDSERSGANMDQTVFRNSEEDDYYDERRRYVDDNRMMAGDWYHNEKGQNKGGNLYSRNKGEIDEFYLHSGYYDDDTHGESFRSFTYNDRKRDDIEYTRWEFKGTGRNNRMVRSLFSEFDTPSWKNNEESFASRSPEENHINNCRWDIMPKNSFYKRHESHRGQYFESSHREDYMIDIDGHVDVGRKRCHYQSEIEWEDEIKFRHKDAKFCAHRNSFLFGRLSRRKRVVSEPYLEHVEELAGDPYIVARSGYLKGLTDGQLSNECRYNKHKNETFNGSKCSKAHGMIHERRPLSSRNSHLIVGEVKSSEKDKKPEWMDLNTCINDKMARAEETKAIDEGLDIEEGQILTKEVKVRPMIDKTREHIDGSHNQNGKSGFDNTRILEAMAKMEKRRARFNEPVTITRKGSDSSFKVTAVDPIQETGSNKQQRPARKRKWGASNK